MFNDTEVFQIGIFNIQVTLNSKQLPQLAFLFVDTGLISVLFQSLPNKIRILTD